MKKIIAQYPMKKGLKKKKINSHNTKKSKNEKNSKKKKKALQKMNPLKLREN